MSPIALTMGDPAGIGGELTLKAWQVLRDTPRIFVALDDPGRLKHLAQSLNLSVTIQPITDPAEAAAIFGTALPVLPVALSVAATPGHPNPANAKAVIA